MIDQELAAKQQEVLSALRRIADEVDCRLAELDAPLTPLKVNRRFLDAGEFGFVVGAGGDSAASVTAEIHSVFNGIGTIHRAVVRAFLLHPHGSRVNKIFPERREGVPVEEVISTVLAYVRHALAALAEEQAATFQVWLSTEAFKTQAELWVRYDHLRWVNLEPATPDAARMVLRGSLVPYTVLPAVLQKLAEIDALLQRKGGDQ